MSWESVYTLSTPGGKSLVSVSANPRTAVVTFTTVLAYGTKEARTLLTISYSVVGDQTTELVTQSWGKSSLVVTAVGKDNVAVVTIGTKTETVTSWTPLIMRIFAPFGAYAVVGSTTYFTAGGDVLETTTLTESGTTALINHVYSVVSGSSTFVKSVVMRGVMEDYSTEVGVTVYTILPTFTYPWINGSKTVLPVVLVSGIMETENTISGGSVVQTNVLFFSVMGDSAPTSVVGYKGGRATSFSGTVGKVYYGTVAITGTNVGSGVFVITMSDMLNSSASVRTTTVSDYITNFYIAPGFLGVSSMFVNGAPVLLASYSENGLTFIVTFDRDYAFVRGVYKVVTDSSGGFFYMYTYAVYNMDVVGVTTIS